MVENFSTWANKRRKRKRASHHDAIHGYFEGVSDGPLSVRGGISMGTMMLIWMDVGWEGGDSSGNDGDADGGIMLRMVMSVLCL